MMDQKQREKCLQEVKLLQSVDHPNIVKYLDSFISDNELYIAIEWADKGDLKRFIKKYLQEGDKIDEIMIIEYTRQLGSALLHMHEKRIIHRDLKPANILIFSDGLLKLGDLGLGRYMSDETFKAFSKVGTPLYMSPEVIRNDGYDFKSDVWSLGCVIYELVTFKSPFRTDEKISLYDLFTKINKGDYPRIMDEKYGTFIKDLIEKMLKVNPEERISLEEVVKMCDDVMRGYEDKPKIDPFIVMEDILEKLKLINYEDTFCKKYKREQISRFYFACSLNGLSKPCTPNTSNKDFNPTISPQLIYFYEISNWLMMLIKQVIQ